MERVLKEADESLKYQLRESERRQKVEEFIQEVWGKENINIKELRAGSPGFRISLVRLQIAPQLLEVYGIPLKEIAH